MKRLFLAVFFVCLLAGIVFADSLEQVKIRSNIPLNENLTISGFYSADVNAEVLCSFKIFDTQTADKFLVKRLSDEYTFSDGSFSTEYKVTEPIFQRGFDYNAVVCCKTSCFDQNFFVSQKSDIALGYTTQSLFYDLLFFRSTEVTVFLVFAVAFLLFLFWVLKRR